MTALYIIAYLVVALGVAVWMVRDQDLPGSAAVFYSLAWPLVVPLVALGALAEWLAKKVSGGKA